MRHLPLSEPLLGLVLGVLVGPQVLGLIDLPGRERPALLEEGARLRWRCPSWRWRCATPSAAGDRSSP